MHLFCLYVHKCTLWSCMCTCVEVSGQLVRSNSLLVSSGLAPGAFLPTNPSCGPALVFYKLNLTAVCKLCVN